MEDKTHPAFFFLLLSGCLGVLVGSLFAIIDLLTGPAGLRSLQSIYVAIRLYGIAGLLCGLLTAACFLLITLSKKEVYHDMKYSFLPGLLVPALLLAYLISGYYINRSLLPWELDDRRSVIFNALFTLCYFIVSPISTWLVLRNCRSRIRPLFPVSFPKATIAISGIILLFSLLPISPSDRASFKDDPGTALQRLRKQSGTLPYGRNNFPIFIILIDALRADNVSCYGYTRTTTPHIDAFARDGTLFLNGFASSPWTIPSVATLFSGLYPSGHNTMNALAVLPGTVTTLAEYLQALGYETACFMGNNLPNEAHGFLQGFSFQYPGREPGWIYRKETALENIYLRFTTDSDYYRGKRLIQRASQWLKERNKDRLFVYLHFMEPHSPYSPPGKYRTMFDPEYKDAPVSMYPSSKNGKSVPVSERVLQNMIAQYDGETAYVDSLLGDFFSYLKDERLYDPALIVLIADHGEAFYEHGSWGHHGFLYRELTKIPFIVKWPQHRMKNTTVDSPAELVDIKTTILDSLHYQSLETEHGASLLSRFSKQEIPLSQQAAFGEDPSGRYSIRTEDWVYMEHRAANEITCELFSSNDRTENNNIAHEHPEITGALRERLQQWIEETGSTQIKPREIPLDEERIKILKSLGYL